MKAISHPPGPGRYMLHYPENDRQTSPPREVIVEDRGDGVLVWSDPYTRSMYGTGDNMLALSGAHRWEPVE